MDKIQAIQNLAYSYVLISDRDGTIEVSKKILNKIEELVDSIEASEETYNKELIDSIEDSKDVSVDTYNYNIKE